MRVRTPPRARASRIAWRNAARIDGPFDRSNWSIYGSNQWRIAAESLSGTVRLGDGGTGPATVSTWGRMDCPVGLCSAGNASICSAVKTPLPDYVAFQMRPVPGDATPTVIPAGLPAFTDWTRVTYGEVLHKQV